ncbi:hypothetical protein [Alkalihalobacterium bogoriense]|nr:hypothetical protein [Alkalihalobacterium bogoriense]
MNEKFISNKEMDDKNELGTLFKEFSDKVKAKAEKRLLRLIT